jgi:membrane-associated phospholipid phosphatase
MEKSNNYLIFIYVLFSSILFILILSSLLISKGEDVLWINGNHNQFLDKFFIVITELGNGLLFVPLILILLFVRFKYTLFTILVWIGHGIVCLLLKRQIFSYLKRPREIINNDLLYFVPDVDAHSHFSFPSGHTATIFCLAILLSLFVRKRVASIAFVSMAVLVAYSRIYLLEHFLMDIAAGAAVGISITFSLWHYFENAQMPTWMDNYLKINLTLRQAHYPE